jgi:hypothetical protein
MVNPAAIPGVSHIFSFLWKIYSRLNALERFIPPTLAVGYKSLFQGPNLSNMNIKIAVGTLLAGALIFNAVELKQKVGHPTGHLSMVEPIIKAGGWGFALMQIYQHLSFLNFLH